METQQDLQSKLDLVQSVLARQEITPAYWTKTVAREVELINKLAVFPAVSRPALVVNSHIDVVTKVIPVVDSSEKLGSKPTVVRPAIVFDSSLKFWFAS